MNNLGIICRSDKSGLAYQSLNLTKMLRPTRVVHIDSRPFRKNSTQNPVWYEGFNTYNVSGFPTNLQCQQFLRGLSNLFICESPYNQNLYHLANRSRVKTTAQVNYEFLDAIKHPNLPRADQMLSPSYWHLEELEQKFGAIYLPPPLFPEEFREARAKNMARTGKRRFLVLMGTQAIHDRNGTQSVLEALEYTKADIEVVIKAQHDVPFSITDSRVRVDTSNPDNNADLYMDYDCMIFPRRYGGLALGMNEALMSGLPVIMTDISPNNQVLPQDWLVRADRVAEFYTRMMIDIHAAIPELLAAKIEEFADMSDAELREQKTTAFSIGFEEFNADKLKSKYEEILG